MSAELRHRVTVTLRIVHMVSLFVNALAMGLLLKGFTRAALASLILAFFLQIVSVETIRAFVVNLARESRR
jgi:hypothetical protein